MSIEVSVKNVAMKNTSIRNCVSSEFAQISTIGSVNVILNMYRPRMKH